MTAPLLITPVTPDDLPVMLELERASFADPWSERMMNDLLDLPVCRALAARREGRLLGFLLALVIPPEGEIADLCVAPEARGQGIGTALLEALTGDSACTEFFLEVRTSNTPARRLYEKLGFCAVGVRKNYYEKPREDALVMKLTLPKANG